MFIKFCIGHLRCAMALATAYDGGRLLSAFCQTHQNRRAESWYIMFKLLEFLPEPMMKKYTLHWCLDSPQACLKRCVCMQAVTGHKQSTELTLCFWCISTSCACALPFHSQPRFLLFWSEDWTLRSHFAGQTGVNERCASALTALSATRRPLWKSQTENSKNKWEADWHQQHKTTNVYNTESKSWI